MLDWPRSSRPRTFYRPHRCEPACGVSSLPPVSDSILTAPPASLTPAMRQYQDAKRQHPDALLFFRMGDFYELFYEDAVVAARALELTLTSRSKDAAGTGIPMCGVPFHAADGYVTRLVKQGFSVAICDQVEDPKSAKGLVKREVTRVVTPGTLTDAAYLDARAPALLAAVLPPPKGSTTWGVAWVELSTGDFAATEFEGDNAVSLLREELGVLAPRELLLPDDADLDDLRADGTPLPAVTRRDRWQFALDAAQRALTEQLQTSGLAGFGLDGHPHAVVPPHQHAILGLAQIGDAHREPDTDRRQRDREGERGNVGEHAVTKIVRFGAQPFSRPLITRQVERLGRCFLMAGLDGQGAIAQLGRVQRAAWPEVVVFPPQVLDFFSGIVQR